MLGRRMGVECRWDPNASWAALQRDELPDARSAYVDTMRRCPVARVEGVFGSFWAVLTHEELVKAAHATDVFSNVVPLFETRRPPLECDPPEHRFFRRLLNPYFARDRMLELEADVRQLAREMLAPLCQSGGDFAERFSHPFPTRVLCKLLKLPDEDWRLINDWGAAVDRQGAQSAPGSEDRLAAGEGIRPYMLSLVEQRRAHPGDDIVSGLIHGDPDLPPLEDEAVSGIVMMLLSAGHNTTTSAIGNLVLRLARDSALQERLRAQPELIPAAVEESLRIDAPQQAMRRVAIRDAEIGGCRVKRGDWVWLVFGAANLDDQAFEDPDVFRLDRSPNRHHGFGRGIHLCLGAPLARLQVRVVVEELFERCSSFAVAGPVTRPEWPRLGVTSMPLQFR